MKAKIKISNIEYSADIRTYKKKREKGYYWVQAFDDTWHIAYWSPPKWLRFGDDDYYGDENFKSIDDQRLIKHR